MTEEVYISWPDKVVFVPSPNYKSLFYAAKAYIDECPCDPDIHYNQEQAWNNYQKILKDEGIDKA